MSDFEAYSNRIRQQIDESNSETQALVLLCQLIGILCDEVAALCKEVGEQK